MRRLLAGLTAIAVAATVLMILSPAEAATRYAVTAFVSTAKVDVGQSVTLRGKVTPKARGQKVKVQRLVGGSWTTITRATLNRRSKYAATIKVTSAGDNRYRVVKPRSAGHKKGVSPIVTVVGWRWRSLTSLPLADSSNATVLASGLLGETVFRPYIELGSAAGGFARRSYVLDGKCAQIDAHVGGTPDSVPAGPYNAQLRRSLAADPTSFAAVSQAFVYPGQDPIHIERGPAVVQQWARVEVFASLAANAYVGWGAVKVYCRS